jgi:hypothetical protein
MEPTHSISHLALYLRSRFTFHTPTVKALVERMSDEQLIAKFRVHRALRARPSRVQILAATSLSQMSVKRDWWTLGVL